MLFEKGLRKKFIVPLFLLTAILIYRLSVILQTLIPIHSRSIWDPRCFLLFRLLALRGFIQSKRSRKEINGPRHSDILIAKKAKILKMLYWIFNREKDIPYTSQVKYLPLPIPTYDLFSASSQSGGGKYRLYRGSSGVYFDQHVENSSNDATLGIEFGGGAYFDVGLTYTTAI